MSFNSPTGHYEYGVIPFGQTNIFQALVNDWLETLEEHVHRVQTGIPQLRENSLCV